MTPEPHQYISRKTGEVVTEHFFGDATVRALYAPIRENAGWLFSILTSPLVTALIGAAHFDHPFANRARARAFSETLGLLNLAECLEPDALTSPRAVFERKIRYWEFRPEPEAPRAVLSPADSRVIPACLAEHPMMEIKGKFFDLAELLGHADWVPRFENGDVAIFRLTPEKYHYTHTPVSGRIEDAFLVDGKCHACHPEAVVREVTPFSRNRRLVTLIDTEVEGGNRVGRVAMVEVVALMIGAIAHAYSETAYETPRPLLPGDFMARGKPKSLFRPGSSTVILLFEKERIRFDADLLENARRQDAKSRFCSGFKRPLVETEVRVREQIATPSP